MVTKKPKITLIDQFNGPEGTEVSGDSFQFIAKEAFYTDGQYFVGGQTDSWAGDVTGWDDLKYGRWAGGGTMFAKPENVSLVGGTVEEEPVSLDPIHRIASGSAVSATLGLSTLELNFVYKPYQFIWAIVNSVTGASQGGELTMTSAGNTVSPEVTGLADGSYVFRVKVYGQLPAQLPPGYVVNNSYRYIENGTQYVYDPEYNIGKVPQDLNHILYKLRQSIVLAGTQKDKPEWTRYLSSSDALSGEWSQIKIVIGEGDWQQNASLLTSVGPVLFSVVPGVSRECINFDILSRSISASAYLPMDLEGPEGIIAEAGSYLFAGNRSTDSGAVLGLWVRHLDGSIDLLGTNLNPSTGVCECALSDHSATRIRVDKANNRVYILTKCSLHEYKPKLKVTEALPGIPEGSGGHPGGHALAVLNNNITFFTENLGALGEVKGNVHFYNSLVRQVAGIRYAGQGTVYQGFNCADTWLGKLWGFYQDKPFGDKTAKVSLAYFDGLNWATRANTAGIPEIDSTIDFDSSDYLWQRVVACNGKLVATGKVQDGASTDPTYSGEDLIETPASFVADGKTFYNLSIPYRAAKLVISPADNPEKDKLFLVGHQVIENNLDKNNYFVVEVDPDGESVIATLCEGEDYCFCTPELDLTLDEAKGMFPHYLWFSAGEWTAHDFAPSDNMTLFLTRTLTGTDGSMFVQYCDTCAISQECTSNCANFFCYNSDTDCFEITEAALLANYTLTETALSPYVVLSVDADNFCFTGQDDLPDSGEVYLSLSQSGGNLSYCVPGGVTLPFNPTSLLGPGNSLKPNEAGTELCVVRCGPPYDYATCSSLRFYAGKVETGNIVEGEFIPCTPTNPKEVIDELPAGTKWKVVEMKPHAEPENIISIVDTNRDHRLKRLNKLYPLLWYRRTASPAYSGSNEDDYLASFIHRAHFGTLEFLGKELDEPIEVLTIVPATLENISLPVIIKVL